MKQRSLVCLLILVAWVAHARAVDGVDFKPMKFKIIEPWKDANIKLVLPGASDPQPVKSQTLQVPVKRAVFEIVPKPDPGKAIGVFSMLLVHDPHVRKKIFIEGEHSFYVSDNTGMKGYTVGPGVVVWSGSYLELPDSTDDASAIAQFEKGFDPEKLQQEWDKRATVNRISFSEAVSKFYFSESPEAGQAVFSPAVDAIDLTDGVLRLDLHNPKTQKPAIIRMNLKTKKVIESTELGQKMNIGTVKLKNLKHTPWENSTNNLLTAAARSPILVNSKKVTYEYEVGHFGSSSISVVAFISDGKRNIWIGPEQDFYLDLDSGILGGKLSPGGFIVWCESMVLKQNLKTTNLTEVIQKFEEDTDINAVDIAFLGGLNDDVRLRHLTDLSLVFNAWAFTDGPFSSTTSPSARLVSSELVDGQVKLELENPASKFVGEAWIDPVTKKVTKAVESGKQVFPR